MEMEERVARCQSVVRTLERACGVLAKVRRSRGLSAFSSCISSSVAPPYPQCLFAWGIPPLGPRVFSWVHGGDVECSTHSRSWARCGGSYHCAHTCCARRAIWKNLEIMAPLVGCRTPIDPLFDCDHNCSPRRQGERDSGFCSKTFRTQSGTWLIPWRRTNRNISSPRSWRPPCAAAGRTRPRKPSRRPRRTWR